MKDTFQPQPADLFANPGDAFCFMSPFRSLVTEGCFRRITTPAHEGALLQGHFQHSLRTALQEAQQAGIEHPIVAGAIPFDPCSPSALFVPQRWTSLNRQQLVQQATQYSGSLPSLRDAQPLPQHETFLQMVSEAVRAMRAGQLDKVVLSRLLEIHTEQPVNSGTLLARLIAQNPHSYNFHVPLPDGSTLLGASPELLLRKQGEQFFSQPLAGSARRAVTDDVQDKAIARELLASGKDRHEHQLVVDAMRHTLNARSEQLQIPATPECITTPTLWHLATSIRGTIRHPQENALSLACLLHPTPALSGFPHQHARELLSKLEPFEREFFGGIVGWCDDKGDGEWAVAIRCGKLHHHHVRLFAGAGIVVDSSPEAEWRETGVKLTTMLHAFGLY